MATAMCVPTGAAISGILLLPTQRRGPRSLALPSVRHGQVQAVDMAVTGSQSESVVGLSRSQPLKRCVALPARAGQA